MQKILLPLLFVMTSITETKAQQRLFDQPVQLKTCNILIEANSFIATTVVEMEFYNPKDQEVEARQNFELNRGQVITDFQLELNGKYREGSIEERWKAVRAYSAVVGKRIDPAILQMNWQNQYSINIYPIAAKSSRKIKFTITQMMEEESSKLIYTLPLKFTGNTSGFKLSIKVAKPASIPYANKGFIEKQLFDMNKYEASLYWETNDVVLNQPISFAINQFINQPQICITRKNDKTHFLMRVYPEVPAYYSSKPKSINVYWDVSLSGRQRYLKKELDFLESYISENEINKATIILFNHELQGTIVFNPLKDNFNSIRYFLLNYKYKGATELGNLNFSNVLSDAVLLFSDGINSVGNAQPKLGAVPVNYITSSYWYYYDRFKSITGNTGGVFINLFHTDIRNAVKKVDSAENFLFRYNASHIKLNESLPIRMGKSILLSGTIDQADNLELVYGNNSNVYKSDNYFLSLNENCDEVSYKKIQMLKAYDSLMYGYNGYYNWQNMVIFGLTEKVVTPQTSFLVLERIEDYIKYKIAPPKELEQKCAEMNYVYRPEYKIKTLKEFTEQDALDAVVKNYNNRIIWWSKNEPLIDLNKPMPEKQSIDNASVQVANKNTTGSSYASGFTSQNDYKGTGSELKEVVVTSAFGIKRTARSTSSSVQNLTGEQVNAIRQTNVNNALAGKVAGAQVRSQSYAKLGAETTIRLRGENGLGTGSGALYVVDGTIMPSGADINPDDVEDYSILQGPAAAALFGPDGSNGAVVITLKKAKRGYPRQYYFWTEYKLSKVADVDYVQEIQKASDVELEDIFLELDKENKMNVGFYFEMADFFFEKGKTAKAQELMYNAIELCNGSSYGLKLAAYLYEKWKKFDKAIAVYKGILSMDVTNLAVKRDLALAYFQNKDFETAVKTYYSIVTASGEAVNNLALKENALAEMNAILLLHKNEFDISYINHNLIKALPVDLRISMESNYSSLVNPQIIEPDNSKCHSKNTNTVNGGRLMATSYNGYGYELPEYIIKKAASGDYRIKIDVDDIGTYPGKIPLFVRVITFKNFQKENMQMEVKIFDLDNQYGVVELDAVNW